MVFQQPNPFPMSIYENVVYGLRINGVKDKQVLDEAVEKALQRVPGVTHAEVSLERGEALVEGDATDDALMQAVADIGYTLRRP